MTERNISSADFSGIYEVVSKLNETIDATLEYYIPIVGKIIDNKNVNDSEIEKILDELLNLSITEKGLRLFRKLCKYYYSINPYVTAEYILAYRDLYDDEYNIGHN